MNRPCFYVLIKDFNSLKVRHYDVLAGVFDEILTKKNTIRKSFHIRSKPLLTAYLTDYFRYHYWGRCQWEFIIVDWPNSDRVEDSHPYKIDVYQQLSPNLYTIMNLVWDFIEPLF